MKNNKAIEILLKGFELSKDNLSVDGDELLIQTWTGMGVNMPIYVDKNDVAVSFCEYVDDYFDIDEEIRLHMEGKDYRKAFSFSLAVKDFEAYQSTLEEIADELRGNGSKKKSLPKDSDVLHEVNALKNAIELWEHADSAEDKKMHQKNIGYFGANIRRMNELLDI